MQLPKLLGAYLELLFAGQSLTIPEDLLPVLEAIFIQGIILTINFLIYQVRVSFLGLRQLLLYVKHSCDLAGRPSGHAMDVYGFLKNRKVRVSLLRRLLRMLPTDVSLPVTVDEARYFAPLNEEASEPVVSLSSSLLRIGATDSSTVNRIYGDGYPQFPSSHTYKVTPVSSVVDRRLHSSFYIYSYLDSCVQGFDGFKSYCTDYPGANEAGEKFTEVAAIIQRKSSYLCQLRITINFIGIYDIVTLHGAASVFSINWDLKQRPQPLPTRHAMKSL